ncbi:hypothetical protein LEMLEM_LOCUS16126 [Lemmus lemmus]
MRKAKRFLFRSVSSVSLWNREASTSLDQISMVSLGGRRVRPLDSLTEKLTEQRHHLGERTC